MRWFLFVLVAGLAGAPACSDSVVEDESLEAAARRQCIALRDHVIDVRLKDATNVDQEAHRQVLTKALGDHFVSQCLSDVSETQRHCALTATDSDSIRACSGSK